MSYKERAVTYLRTRAMRDPAYGEMIHAIADHLDDMEDDLAVRKRAVEPFFKGGVVGREVVRCGNCGQEEIGRGNYCKGCGMRLVDKIEEEPEW